MKVSLVYPKIPTSSNFLPKKCVIFDKLDGTNIHFVFNPQEGWTHFGTRRERFPYTSDGIKEFQSIHYELTEVPFVFKGMELGQHLKLNYSDSKEIIVFFEFLGPESFAGNHQAEDKKELILIDVLLDGKFLPPEDFVKSFASFDIPRVLWQGKYSGQVVEDIRQGKYQVAEGAILKGTYHNEVYQAKVKTNRYMELLKKKFQDRWEDYWE